MFGYRNKETGNTFGVGMFGYRNKETGNTFGFDCHTAEEAFRGMTEQDRAKYEVVEQTLTVVQKPRESEVFYAFVDLSDCEVMGTYDRHETAEAATEDRDAWILDAYNRSPESCPVVKVTLDFV